jgi:hypothetical protein
VGAPHIESTEGNIFFREIKEARQERKNVSGKYMVAKIE